MPIEHLLVDEMSPECRHVGVELVEHGVQFWLGVVAPDVELQRKTFEDDQSLRSIRGDRGQCSTAEEPRQHDLLGVGHPVADRRVHRKLVVSNARRRGPKRRGEQGVGVAVLLDQAGLTQRPDGVEDIGAAKSGVVDHVVDGSSGADEGTGHRKSARVEECCQHCLDPDVGFHGASQARRLDCGVGRCALARESSSMKTDRVARWPVSAQEARDMYAAGRGDERARWYARNWSRIFRTGLLPKRWVSLEVPGRVSGRPTSCPLGMADVGGRWFLVSMLGECNWVSNVRAVAGHAVLRRLRRRRVVLVEVPVHDRAPILRRYVAKVPGGRPHIPVPPGAPISEFEAIAGRYPVFEVRDDESP